MQQFLAQQFEKGFLQLRNELNAYSHRNVIWHIDCAIRNSAGNLCLHILGNINHYIGHVLGGLDYQRNRADEFRTQTLPVAQLMIRVDETAFRTKTIVAALTHQQLSSDYPQPASHLPRTTAEVLVYLLAHFQYHLGQINYHRRLLDNPSSLPPGVSQL